MKEEEGNCLSGGYRNQVDPVRNGLFPDTGNTSASVFCTHFLENIGTLSSLGKCFTINSIDSINFSA